MRSPHAAGPTTATQAQSTVSEELSPAHLIEPPASDQLELPGVGVIVLGTVLKRPSRQRGGEAVVRVGRIAGRERELIVKSRPHTNFGVEGHRRETTALRALSGLRPAADPLAGRVPELLAAWEDDRGLHIVMDRLAGRTALDLVTQPGRTPDLDVDFVADIVERLGATVGLIHTFGYGHNDLSWGNVLVHADEQSRAVLGVGVVDFGLATPLGEAAPRAATPGFIATRQWRDGIALPENDAASLARVTYSLLTRINPNRTDLEPVARIRGDVGERASQVLSRGIANPSSFAGTGGPVAGFAAQLVASLRSTGPSELLADLRRSWQATLASDGPGATRLGEIESGLRHDVGAGGHVAALLEIVRMWATAAAAASAQPQAGVSVEALRARAAAALADAVVAPRPPGAPLGFRSGDVEHLRDLHALTADFLTHRGASPAGVDRQLRSFWLAWAGNVAPQLRQVAEFRPDWVDPPPERRLPPPPPVVLPAPWTTSEPPAVSRPTPWPVRMFVSGWSVVVALLALVLTAGATMATYRPDVPSWHLLVAPAIGLAAALAMRLRLRRWRRTRRWDAPATRVRRRLSRVTTSLALGGVAVLTLSAPLPPALSTGGGVVALALFAASVLSLGAPTRGDVAALLTNLVSAAVLVWAAFALAFQGWLVHTYVPQLTDAGYRLLPSFLWPEAAGATVNLRSGVSLGAGATSIREVRVALRDGFREDRQIDVAHVRVEDDTLTASVALADPTAQIVLLVPPDELIDAGWFDGQTGHLPLGPSAIGAIAPSDRQTDAEGETVRWDLPQGPLHALALGVVTPEGDGLVAIAPVTDGLDPA